MDRQRVWEFFYAKPLLDLGKSLFSEMCWVKDGREDKDQDLKTLPDYCYHIFDALRITYFKNFPAQTDIIFIKDRAGMAGAKTIEDAKKVIQLDWKNLRRIVGVGLRCQRFAEKEAELGVDEEPLKDFRPEDVRLRKLSNTTSRLATCQRACVLPNLVAVICAITSCQLRVASAGSPCCK